MVVTRDTLRSRHLTKALQLHRPWRTGTPGARGRGTNLVLPGDGEALINEELNTTADVNLCLFSPYLAGRVGEPIRGRVLLNKHGNNTGSEEVWAECTK